MTADTTNTPVQICRGSALWYGPPGPPKPTCSDGHPTVVMKLLQRPQPNWRCRRCRRTVSATQWAAEHTSSPAYRAWQQQADQEMAAEARLAHDERHPYLNRLHLSDLQGIRTIQIRNLQINDRRNEQWSETHRQWQWAHTVRPTSAKATRSD